MAPRLSDTGSLSRKGLKGQLAVLRAERRQGIENLTIGQIGWANSHKAGPLGLSLLTSLPHPAVGELSIPK